MAEEKVSQFLSELASVIDPNRVNELNQRFGVVKRVRKIDLVSLIWVLVLSQSFFKRRTIEGLRLAYERFVKNTISRSSFYERLNEKLSKLMHELVLDGFSKLKNDSKKPEGYLTGFKELIAVDATVLNLYKIISTRKSHLEYNGKKKSSAKLQLVMNISDGTPSRIKLTNGRVNDTTAWKNIGKWVKNRLLLIDLGYYSFRMFDNIDRNHGSFLSRAKKI